MDLKASSFIIKSHLSAPADQFEARVNDSAAIRTASVGDRVNLMAGYKDVNGVPFMFSHIMGGYAAGYYAYIWSEVLDADSVEWFKENGGLKRENGDHFRKTLLSRGGSVDAMQLFKDFRGRDPDVKPLLERRGLTAK